MRCFQMNRIKFLKKIMSIITVLIVVILFINITYATQINAVLLPNQHSKQTLIQIAPRLRQEAKLQTVQVILMFNRQLTNLRKITVHKFNQILKAILRQQTQTN